MLITLHSKLKSQGWFYPMYSIKVDGKTYYQSPKKITRTRLHAIASGRKPILFTWDNRLWFK